MQQAYRRGIPCSGAALLWLCLVAQVVSATLPSHPEPGSLQQRPSAHERTLQQKSELGQFSGTGIFSDVQPCQPLLDILGEDFHSTARWGQFLQPPTQQLIQDCVENSSLAIFNGNDYLFALGESYPRLKVMRIESESPIVIPFADFIFEAGEVLILDCQETWMDLRALPGLPPIDFLAVYTRCNFLLSELVQGTGTQTWLLSSSSHRDCTALSSVETNNTRESPGLVVEAHPHFGPWALHMYNSSEWCWTQEDLKHVFGTVSDEDDKPRLWIIGLGLLAGLGGCGVLMIFLTPLCIRRARRENSGVSSVPSRTNRHLLTSEHTSVSRLHNTAHTVICDAVAANPWSHLPRFTNSSDLTPWRNTALAMSDIQSSSCGVPVSGSATRTFHTEHSTHNFVMSTHSKGTTTQTRMFPSDQIGTRDCTTTVSMSTYDMHASVLGETGANSHLNLSSIGSTPLDSPIAHHGQESGLSRNATVEMVGVEIQDQNSDPVEIVKVYDGLCTMEAAAAAGQLDTAVSFFSADSNASSPRVLPDAPQ